MNVFNSLPVRLVVLFGLILALQIPILAIEGTVRERESTRLEAIRDITSTWGEAQTVAGPLIAVPYREHLRDEKGMARVATHLAYFLPDSLAISGKVTTERRYRGIFEVPVYTATLTVSGTMSSPDFGRWQVPAADIMWSGASLVVGTSDPKALRESVKVIWDGAPHDFGPGSAGVDFLPAGISLPQPELGGEKAGTPHRFAFDLVLGGSSSLHFMPLGTETDVNLTADWRDPSFSGAFLPAERAVGDAGFSARWHVPNLGRNYPQRLRDGEIDRMQLLGSAFGVSFLAPVTAYTATTRSVKYELLFVGLTFTAFFLIEVLRNLRVHPVQYLLVGFALCLFYLLLLALSEQLGFGLAYLTASTAVVATVGGYCFTIFRSGKLAAIIAGALTGLYGLLYALLKVQDYALIVGAVGLFVVLALVMYLTRRIDWFKVGKLAKLSV